MPLSKFTKRAAFILLCSLVSCGAEEANVAWLKNGTITIRSLDAHDHISVLSPSDKVPLGSLWKLFVYIYLADTKANEPSYICSGDPALKKEEQYCCTPGLSIDRDKALSHSCAPYFEPSRLNIDPSVWKYYWQTKNQPAWLQDIHNLKPATEVSISDLLHILDTIPTQARSQARNAMLETSISGFGRTAWNDLGSGIRYKTYSWHRHDGKAFGGAAGWLAEGTPFWFGALGTSSSTLKKYSSQLSAALPPQNLLNTTTDNICVDVDFFGQYPLKSIRQKNYKKIESGQLNGEYQLEFFNGNRLNIHSRSNLYVKKLHDNSYKLSGRLGLNHYVARVIDREGNTSQPEAARALAIAART
ncbi:MAG: DUF2300 domain-containing protein, partial [Sulfuricurvum sp.]|nr:DUF2300 domain-containing protein [Sulfuricurvum sp.]